MNYKLEKFWNEDNFISICYDNDMNYKLEKFWNLNSNDNNMKQKKWTINLKSFEIFIDSI